MPPTAKKDAGPDDGDGGPFYDDEYGEGGQDPVRSMHDTQEGAGDEVGIADIYSVDMIEARQMGVALDRTDEQEAELS